MVLPADNRATFPWMFWAPPPLMDYRAFSQHGIYKTGHLKEGLNLSFGQIEQITESNNSVSASTSFQILFLHQHFETQFGSASGEIVDRISKNQKLREKMLECRPEDALVSLLILLGRYRL